MRIQKLACAVSVCGLISVVGATATGQRDAAAVAAARTWLGSIDRGAYTNAWNNAAAYLQNNVGQETFCQQIQGARTPLGKLVSRKLIGAKDLTSVPGGPDGKYVLIQFSTSFAHKKSAIETITPMLDKDGKWRVSGYFIK